LQSTSSFPYDAVSAEFLASAPLIILLFSGEQQHVDFVHPKYFELIPRTIDHNADVNVQIRSVEQPAFFKALQEVYADGRSRELLNQPYQSAAGSPGEVRIFNQFFSAYKDEAGVQGVICNMVEVTDVQKRLQQVEASEKLFRQVAEVMPQLVWIANPDGTVTYYNNRIAEFAGAVKDPAGNWQWGGMLHPDDMASTGNAWSKSVATGTLYEIAHRVKMRQGDYRWHLSRAYPQLDNNGAVIRWFGTATDIHFQKDYEAKLAESEERLRMAMDAAEMGSWEYNFQTGKVVASDKLLEIFGIPSNEELTMDRFFALVHPDDLEQVISRHKKLEGSVLTDINQHQLKYRIINGLNGELRWIKSNRKVFYDPNTKIAQRFIGTILDITNEKLAEEKLRYRQAMLEAQNQAIPDGIIILNTEGQVLSYNHRFEQLFSIPSEHLEKGDAATAFAIASQQLEAHENIVDFIHASVKEQAQSPRKQFRLTNGRVLERHGKPVLGENQRLYGWAWYFRDITAEVRSENDLRKQKELYENLLEGISDAFISFDFNWNIIYANNHFARSVKKATDELIGKNFWDIYPMLLGSEMEATYKSVMSTRMPEKLEIKSLISNSWFDVRAYPISEGISVFSSDISQRRAAEEELNYQKQLLQTVTENTSLALFLMDANQQCIYVNEAGEKMTGFNKEDLQGKQLHYHLHHSRPDGSLYPMEDCPIEQALPTRQRMTGGEVFVHKDGSLFPVFFTASPIIINDVPIGTVIEVRDTTEEKKSERALKESEERFRSAFASASIGMAITDSAGNFIQVNEAFRKITGYSEAELLRRNYYHITHPDDLEPEADSTSDRPDSYVKEKRYIRKDGGLVWVRISGSIVRDESGNVRNEIALAEDVTIKKITQKKLLESEIQFRQLADLVPQLIWTADPRGVTTYKNKRWDAYTQSIMPAGSYDWLSVLHPDDLQKSKQLWTSAVSTGGHFQTEFRLREVGGDQYRWFLAKAIPVTDADGHILKWFGTCTDIHDQKTMSEKMELLVRQRTNELQRSNEDLLQFAHIASHDLKEPLRKIMTFSSRINDEFHAHLPEQARKYLQKIGLAADRMNRMIEGVLEYSVAGSEKLPVEEINLSRIIADVVGDLEVAIELRRAEIGYANLPTIRGVHLLMHQLFYNLVNNSLKFSKPDLNPRIDITYQLIGLHEAGALNLNLNGQVFHLLTVSDNGIGFNEDQSARIFHTFTRLNSKDRYEGTGLGLALCRKIVSRHQGYIFAEGKEGVGATFKIYLPVAQSQELI